MFKFDLIVPSSALMLSVRCLPAKANAPNDNSRFCGADVGALTVESFPISYTKMHDHCMDFKDLYPSGPVVLSESALTKAYYRRIILEEYKNILVFCRVFKSLSVSQTRDYLRDPKFDVTRGDLIHPISTEHLQRIIQL